MPTIRAKDLTNTMTSFGNSDFIAGDENASNETKKVNSEAIRAGMAVASPSAKGLMSAEINAQFNDDDELKGLGIAADAIIGAVKDADGNFDIVANKNVSRKNFISDPLYLLDVVPSPAEPYIDSEGYVGVTNITRSLITNTLILEPGLSKIVQHEIGMSYSGNSVLTYWLGNNKFSADDFFIQTGKINITLEVICDHDIEIRPVLYKHQVSPDAYIAIHEPAAIQLTANKKQIIHLYGPLASLTNLNLLNIIFWFDGTATTIRGHKIYIGRIFSYAGDYIPLLDTSLNLSRIEVPKDKMVEAFESGITLKTESLQLVQTLAYKNLIPDPYYLLQQVPYYYDNTGGYFPLTGITNALIDNAVLDDELLKKIVESTIGVTHSAPYFFLYWLWITMFENDPLFVATEKLNITIEVICDNDVTIRPVLYKHEVSPSAFVPVQDLGATVLTANTKRIIKFSVTLADLTNLDTLAIYLFYDGTASDLHGYKFYYGRMFMYAGEDQTMIDTFIHPDRHIPPGIVLWGDSLTEAAGFTTAIRDKFRNTTIHNNGVGGQLSQHIKVRLLNDTDHKEWFSILWLGRNNDFTNDFTEQVLADIKECLLYLGHERFLIMNPINGDWADDRKPEQAWAKFVEIENLLLNLYGPRFINIRKILINDYDYKNTRLVNSFTQPSVGSNVSINISTTAWLTAADEIGIGKLGTGFGSTPIVDFYTVISVDDATHITARLDTSNVVAPAGTVQNTTTTVGGTTATNYKRVYLKQDVLDYIDDIVPETLRTDGIHLEDAAYDLIVSAISNRMKSLINS